MTLGQKIREARQSKGMTQKELVGDYITRNMLSKIENDSASPSVRTLEYLAGALGFPTGYFLSGAPVSDGTAPDGLDEARAAYREHRWNDCLTALEADNKAGSTDEGYLLHALAGAAAARYASGQTNDGPAVEIQNGEGVGYTVPQKYRPAVVDKKLEIFFRVRRVYGNSAVVVTSEGEPLARFKREHLAPGEMEHITLPAALLAKAKGGLQVAVEEEQA